MVKQDPHRAGMLRPGPTPGIPKQLQASYRLWLVAVAAGVFETTLVVWSTPPPGRSAQSYRGATAEVGDDRPPLATATRWWVHRRGPLDHPAQDQARIAAARRHGTAVEPFASGVYVNDLTDEGKQASGGRTHRHADAAGGAEGRHDPGNLFHLNHNIHPQGAARVIARICPATFEQARTPNQTHDRDSTT
jgi:hypothetical protein